LSAFFNADLNKVAWQGQFKLRKIGQWETYSCENEKVPVKKFSLNRVGNTVKGIVIVLRDSNVLYTSSDTLSYYPDSLYRVIKVQHITFLNSKKYNITGRF
jgi:hypothetical protein